MENYAHMIELTEKIKQGGGDINALLANLQTLAANSTTPLGLNQWVSSDKPTMEDFNRDNRIVDEKFQEIDASLANKVDVADSLHNLGIVQSPATILQFITGLNHGEGGYFTCVDTISDAPESGFGTALYIPSAARYNLGYVMWFKDETNPRHYIRYYRQGVWHSDWTRLATAEPPKDFELPVNNNVQSKIYATYTKTQEGLVSVSASLILNKPLTSGETVNIATLPEGFRPKLGHVSSYCEIRSVTLGVVGGKVTVGGTGIVSISAPTSISYDNLTLCEFSIHYYSN